MNSHLDKDMNSHLHRDMNSHLHRDVNSHLDRDAHRWTRILPMSIPLQHDRRADSIDSPDRMTDTPQSLPYDPVPLYGVPVGVITVRSSKGSSPSPYSTTCTLKQLKQSQNLYTENEIRMDKSTCLALVRRAYRLQCKFSSTSR